jgi:DNA oxidative demethylase
MPDLFAAAGIPGECPYEAVAPGAALLRGFALPYVDEILGSLKDVSTTAPFRHMTTPWGAAMSVAMTNCGDAGWLTDRTGYRYDRVDPESGRP